MWARHGCILNRDAPSGSDYYDDLPLGINAVYYAANSGIFWQFPVLMFGGIGVEARIVAVTLGSGTTTAVSGLGFEPNCLIAIACGRPIPTIYEGDGFIVNEFYSIGMWARDPAGNTAHICSTERTIAYSPNTNKRSMRNDRLIFAENEEWSASVASTNSDGFTLSHDTGIAGQQILVWAARVPAVKVGWATEGSGTQQLVTDFHVGALLAVGAGCTSFSGIEDHGTIMLGLASKSTVGGSHWSTQGLRPLGTAFYNQGTALWEGPAVSYFDPDGTNINKGTVTSWDADGVTLNWVGTAGSRRYGYMAFGTTEDDPPTYPPRSQTPHTIISISAARLADPTANYGHFREIYVNLGFATYDVGGPEYASSFWHAGSTGSNGATDRGHHLYANGGHFGNIGYSWFAPTELQVPITDFVPGIYRYDA